MLFIKKNHLNTLGQITTAHLIYCHFFAPQVSDDHQLAGLSIWNWKYLTISGNLNHVHAASKWIFRATCFSSEVMRVGGTFQHVYMAMSFSHWKNLNWSWNHAKFGKETSGKKDKKCSPYTVPWFSTSASLRKMLSAASYPFSKWIRLHAKLGVMRYQWLQTPITQAIVSCSICPFYGEMSAVSIQCLLWKLMFHGHKWKWDVTKENWRFWP